MRAAYTDGTHSPFGSLLTRNHADPGENRQTRGYARIRSLSPQVVLMKKLVLVLTAAFASVASAGAATAADVARWERQARSVTIIRDDWGIPHISGNRCRRRLRPKISSLTYATTLSFPPHGRQTRGSAWYTLRMCRRAGRRGRQPEQRPRATAATLAVVVVAAASGQPATALGASLLVVALVTGAADVARDPAARLEATPGLENVGLVASGLYRGSAPTREGVRTLKMMGIKTVVNLRHYHGSREGDWCREEGLDYVRLVLASSDAPRDEDVREFLKIATDPARRPVYFHCWRGKDRTGVMCAAYRMAVEGWSFDEANREMEAFGFFPGWRDLRRYVEGLASRTGGVWPAR